MVPLVPEGNAIMKLHTLFVAGFATLALSGAAFAAGDVSVSVQQQSTGGLGSRNSATVNTAGRGTQDVSVFQDGARTQSATVNARSGRGDAIGTIVQTNGRNNSATMNLTARRGTADGILVQDGRNNAARVNMIGGRGVVFHGVQNATNRNSLTGNVRAFGNAPVLFNAAQTGRVNLSNIRVR